MEEAKNKGTVKHVLLAKFKDGVSPEKIEELIKGYANLVNLIEPMKAFHWGEDVSIENLHQGYTHIFESAFDSKEAVAEYVAHPVHVEFATMFLGSLDKVLVIDYKPTSVSL
ncbi:PREDICTED: stress-response A/B barrel domain-containing protein HS1-like [Camelina sativa]|uniref:Stress-response A/B barrel domain-containing protein HS1-like n=1 Tax=Camelina sativa TaxID=90675 RepID=A0ABM0YS80_CAMSA|nr:PREDICTED: stress-response A/B barrel domain-containing protein HS1-like [Camelina sativa]